MPVTHSDLARRIHAVSHLTGQFTLRSGRTATEYFDKYRFEGDPVLLDEIARAMAGLVPSDTEVLAGLAADTARAAHGVAGACLGTARQLQAL